MATKESNPVLPLPFQRGQALKAADLEMLRTSIAFALDGMIGAGPGLLIGKRGSKWIISAERPRNYAPTALPFQAYLSSATEIKINASSRLYKSISTTDTLTVSALSTAITLASNTCVWVQVTVSSLTATAATIASGTAYPTMVVTSGSPAVQTQFNVPLGKVTATNPTAPGFEFTLSGTTYHFEQCLFSHLLIENRCNSGTPIIYGFPWIGA